MSLALMQPQIDFSGHSETTEWLPLERILSAYLEMIDEGKVVPRPMVYQDVIHERNGELVNITSLKYVDESVQNELSGGWGLASFTGIGLQRTLDAFDRLIAVIEDKIATTEDDYVIVNEQQAVLERESKVKYGLADAQTLNRAGITNSFHREFLLRARRPSTGIRYIAPGIRISTTAELTNQPFKNVMDDEFGIPGKPVLVFAGDGNAWSSGKVNEYALKWNRTCYDDSAFSWPYNSINEYPSGLYMSDVGDWPEHASLVLPVQVSEGKYSRRADGTLWSGHKDLYSLGHNKFIYSFGTRLRLILENWAELVESGEWEVDARGVSGGAERFRNADTEDHWSKYQLVPTW